MLLSNKQKAGLALALLIATEEKKKKKLRKPSQRKRIKPSHFNIIRELDSDDFRINLRMDHETFYELLEMVRPLIEKKDTVMRVAVSAEERLIATLKYLATGRKYKELRFSMSTSFQFLSVIIPETCWAIYTVLKDTIKMPSSELEWRESAHSFNQRWQFNNCVGAMAGKHIVIQKPNNSGSLYHNYTGTFSVILFAAVNANYEFMYVHAGSNGNISDGEILKKTKFYEKLTDDNLMLPESCSLPGTDLKVPYVFLGDDAFALEKNVMKPYLNKNISFDKRIFNYRLYRAQRVANNAFGLLSSRFRIFLKLINLKVENVDAIILASCALHNYLISKCKYYLDSKSVDSEDLDSFVYRPGDWRMLSTLTPLERPSKRNTNDGVRVRNILTDYFNNIGKVSFQDKMVDIVK